MPQHDSNSPHAIVRRQACRNPINVSWKPKTAKPLSVCHVPRFAASLNPVLLNTKGQGRSSDIDARW
ncbi:hypothetical protein QR685DRAFT_567671 [Neurospora intermedia]|uniref:Uncharacterized protein n=1 Tax=Neurospora intermedia TaxID=5142 RepID=A0ABR3DQ32_NEUIN